MPLYTFLIYDTVQIWLPHCKYKSHNHDAKWEYRPNIFTHGCQNTTNYNTYFDVILMFVPVNNMPLKCHICQIHKFVHVKIKDIYISVYASNASIKNMTRITGIHIFHFIGICHWTNMPANCIYMSHCTVNVVYM